MALSELINLLSGVIQSSIIISVVFLIYIDGLAELLEHHGITAKLFADDVKVYMIIHSSSAHVLRKLYFETCAYFSARYVGIRYVKCTK